jgi:GNAT superfamily N-acetyltransferase
MPDAIRRLERSDFEAWVELWRGYLRFYRAELPEDVTATTFERLVSEAGDVVGLVAEGDRGALLGFAHLVFHPSTWSPGLYCYLEDLFVSPAARGTSTARRLFAAVYAEADRRGAAKTYWQTQQYNGAARSLYDQVGHPTSFIVYER